MLGTRPDITFAVTKLAQQSANPTKDHLSKAKHILAYLNSTHNYTLDYDGKSGLDLVAFVDLDWESDPNTLMKPNWLSFKISWWCVLVDFSCAKDCSTFVHRHRIHGTQ
jgi:hypothetical protein